MLDNWYNVNLSGYETNIAIEKYCNDRNMASGYNWESQPNSTFRYAGYDRIANGKTPTLLCGNSGDSYTLKIGLITIDEASFAGGIWGTANNLYYLYTGQNYWTMTPSYAIPSYAGMFYVNSEGRFSNGYASNVRGVRPVINLKADTLFATGGTGTADNPYVVQ